MDNRTAAPRSTPPSTPPTSSADDTASDSTAPESSATGSEPAASPTTAASPSRPTAADVELLSFAQQFELTARDLYDAALAGAVNGTEHVNVFRALRENHEEYANSLSALLGVSAPQRRDDASYDSLEGAFAGGDLAAIIAAAYDLESTAVVTHTDLVGRLEGLSGAETLSAALLVESSHCTVLASVAGNGDDLAAMLDNSATPQAPTGGTPAEPAPTEPAATEPAATEPDGTEPAGTEPDGTATDGSTTDTTEA